MDPFSFAAVLAVVAALSFAGWAARRSLFMESRLRQRLEEDLSKARADLAQMAESVEEMIDRARSERARADGRRGGRPAAAPSAPQFTRESYLAYLERGGRSIPEVDAQLGLH